VLLAVCLISCVFALDGDTFTVNCSPLTIQRSDPILQPAVPGGHTHSVIGGNAFSRSMPGAMDAQKSTATSCDKKIDLSNYWVPSLYHERSDGSFELVHWSHSAVYYQKRACNYSATARSCPQGNLPLAFPYGFRMIAGNPYRRSQNNSDFAQKAVSMMCLQASASKEYNGFPPTDCLTIRAQVYFPSCWNGKDVDPSDHMSHMAYPAIGDYNGGVCPSSHPVALLSIFYEFFFDVGTYTDRKFVFANGDPTGYGFHGDFVMGWTDRDKLQTAHRDCVSAADCPSLGNQPASQPALLHPAPTDEDVGTSGKPIAKLPGNNPVTTNPVIPAELSFFKSRL